MIFASFWVSRFNAAARINGMNYSNFVIELKKSGILLNRKILSQVALRDQEVFEQLFLLITN